jgi:formylglycine-generating enzyme required for sulfatase activity
MHGNVFEWCLDKYRDFELEKRTETRVNYPGESETSSYIQKTLRGGSRAKAWNECASHIFFSAAWDDAAFAKNYSVGYRVCVKAVIP